MNRADNSWPVPPSDIKSGANNRAYKQAATPDSMSAGDGDNTNRQWRHYGPIQATDGSADNVRALKKSPKKSIWPQLEVPILLLSALAVIFSAFAFYRANEVYLALNQLSGNILSAAQNPNSAGGIANPSDGAPTAPKPGAPVDVAIEKDDPTIGRPDAPITIVEFSDFQCPFCKRFAPTMDQIIQEYGDKIRFAYRDFPLSFHENSKSAAIAAQCSFKLSDSQTFFKFHDGLFANQAELGDDLYKKTAAKLGLDATAFAACQKDPAIAAEVDKDLQDGIAAGVQGTPATFINGQSVNGAVPYDQVKAIIESKIK